MIDISEPAQHHLRALLAEHPEESIVRLVIQDLDEHHIGIQITLDSAASPDDAVTDIRGLTVAIAREGAARLDGAVLDYNDTEGFKVRHPADSPADSLRLFHLN